MSSQPLSAKKTREAARSAVLATNAQAEVLDGLITQHNHLVTSTQQAVTQLTDAINGQKQAFFARGFVGRLKFLVLGR